METIRNVTQLLVGKKVALTVLTDLDLINLYTQLKDGEVAILDVHNRYLDGATAAEANLVKFVQRTGTKLIYSDVMDLTTVSLYSINSTAAETQQLDFVGWNGVSGELDEIASNIYTIRINYREELIAGFMQQKIKEGFWKSSAVAASYSQQTVAEGLVASLVANYSREAEKDITFAMTNGGARTDATATGITTFIKGSKVISAATDIDAVAAVGDLIGPDDSDLTQPLYRIVSMNTTANTAVLAQAYQGETVAAAAAAVAVVATATALAADYGVQLQGLDRLYKTGYFASRVAQWVTQIDFGETSSLATVTSTGAYPGVGTSQQMGTLEKELQADEYVYRSFVEGGVIDRADIVQGAAYDVMVLEHKHLLQSAQGTPTESPKTLEIAWETGTNLVEDDVADSLELLLTAAGTPYTSQVGNIT